MSILGAIRREVKVLFEYGATSDRIVRIAYDYYIRGLQAGYDLADHDFFNATKRNGEIDEDWYTNRPGLKRALAGFARWQKHRKADTKLGEGGGR